MPTPQTLPQSEQDVTRETKSYRLFSSADLHVAEVQVIELRKTGKKPTLQDVVESALVAYRTNLEQEQRNA